MNDFTHTTLGRTGLHVHRLGLSASHWPGKRAVHWALDRGVNYFFLYGFDLQMARVMRDLPKSERARCVIATGAYNYIFSRQNLERTLHKRLRQLRTDHIDLFLFLGVMKGKEFPAAVRDELLRLRETGKARYVGVSIHDRKFAGKLAAEGDLDVLMIRYNAAHRGAEQDVFPHARHHDPGIVSYTATRWRRLLHRPHGLPKEAFQPTAGQCYRFVLSNPGVHVCMTAPSNAKQLEENFAALDDGPLSDTEMERVREFGDVVHERRGWFMGG
jgi:aryl-alcohol dehydrogenase-like predicted oxidoreductase